MKFLWLHALFPPLFFPESKLGLRKMMWGYAFGIFLGNDIHVVPKKMRWNSVRNLMCVGRYAVMLHFASLISHNLRCIPAYAHLIPTGFFLLNYHRANLYIISYFQFGDTLLVCIETCQRHVATLWCNVAPIFLWIKKLLRCVWEAGWSLPIRSSLCGGIAVWVGYFL